MSRKAKIIVFVGAGLIAADAFAVVQMRKDRNGRVEVQTAAIERREIVQTVTATGRIQPVTQVDISADVSAKIIRLPVKEGEWVEKGQLLVELDRERYLAEVESAEATLRATEAQAVVARENLQKANKDFERSNDLFEKTVESRATLDAVSAVAEAEKARHRAALDQVEQARAALKQVRDALSKTTIYAPMAGTVSRLNKEEGEIALGSQFQADVIMEISNLAGMEALVAVDENDIVNVSLGDKAKIEVDALPDVVFEGAVTEIANSAKVSSEGTAEQKTEFEVKIAIQDPGARLRPGMTASAEIVTEVRPDALGVPIQSVAVRTPEQLGLGGAGKKNGEGDAPAGDGAPAPAPPATDKDGFLQVVFVVTDGVAHARPVKTGIQSDSHIELLEGAAAGDQVVVGSYRAISRDLKDGARVKEAPAGAGDGPGGPPGAVADHG